jgi:tripartite-type tricarboxylate transporter receptor subunit TctC
MPSRPGFAAAALAAAIVLPVAQAAWPQTPPTAATYPSRTIRIYAGSPPGSGTDLVARLMAVKLGERLDNPVVVEQKIGSAGLLAAEAVARALPDGHTLVLLSGAHAANAALRRTLPYDPVKDFAMIGTVVSYPLVISVRPDSPISSLADLIRRARAAPGKLTYAMTPGTLVHLLGEWVNIEAGTSILSVPYKGSAMGLTDVMAGRVDVTVETATAAQGSIRSGRIRPLAISSAARHPLLPDVPTISETLPGVEMTSWLGFVAPAGTPRAIVDRLNVQVRAIVALPDVEQRLAGLSGVPMTSSPEEMRALIEREIARWKRVVALKKIPLQN